MTLTLPPPSKSFGAISNVFPSSLAAVQGNQNQLGFRSCDSIVVVLVDGLGADQLRERSGHAPFLASQLKNGSIVQAAFPATTSANVASLATGLMPGAHGLIGHQVWDRHHNERINLLVGWNERTDPRVWQPHATIAEQAAERGIPFFNVAHQEYRETPYTVATMRGAEFAAADSIAERFARARELVATNSKSLTYLYIPELDKYGHKHGWRSPGWAALLEEVEAQVKLFASHLPKRVGLVITSDHGMVETEKQRQLVLDDELSGLGLEFFGGDTRAAYLYLEDDSAVPEAIIRLQPLAHALRAVSATDMINAGWYGVVGQEAAQRMPELILLARNNFTLYHSQFSKQRAFDMVSHHGAISDAELRIPLIRFGV